MSGYCGCCGRGVRAHKGDPDPMWCGKCMGHVAATGPPWERTYQAINGEPCPFQVRSGSVTGGDDAR